MVPVFKNVGERSTTKNYHAVSLLSVVNKVFEKLANNNIVDHLEKCGLFSDFLYGFRSLQSNADLPTVAELLGLLTGLGLLELWYLLYPRLLIGFGILIFFTNFGISGQIFGLISSFFSKRHLRVVLDGKSSQEYPVNAGVPQDSILHPTIFILYISDLPDDVICDIAIYDDDTTLYSKCNQASYLWQQLKLAFKIESDL